MAKVPETSLTSLLNIVFDSGRPQSLQKKKELSTAAPNQLPVM